MNKLRFFNKNELIATLIILSVLGAALYKNMILALRRARDAQRRADINALVDQVSNYGRDFTFVPVDEDGKIRACKGENFASVVQDLKKEKDFDRNLFFSGLTGCQWGKDSLTDVLDESFNPYIKILPQDPKTNEGLSYLYLSNGTRFQIYAYLEGEADEEGFRDGIVKRNLRCGNKICNFGKAYGTTPLEKSIEDYEKELLEKEK